MCPTRSDVRIDLARAELVRLRNEIDDWLKYRRGEDGLQQYSTQLDALDVWLHQVIEALDGALAALPAGGTVRAAYKACRDVEKKTTWMRQVWRFYADKFDQREDPDTGIRRALKAADEAVWSCFAGAYPAQKRPTAPLPYLDLLYSPEAIPRDKTDVLRNKVIDIPFLNEFLEQLPLPVIGLLEACARAPWWLIYIGHEVGHHLQHDLLPKKDLVTKFSDCLVAALSKAASKGVAVSPDAAGKWAGWSEEVFADTISVYSLGPRAAWAIAELEMGDDVDMLIERKYYPPAIVRLALMAQLPVLSASDRTVALADVDPDALTKSTALVGGKDLRAAARDHLRLVPILAEAIDTWDGGGLGGLRAICKWQGSQFAAGGTVDQWRDRLLSSNPMALVPSLDAPRLILSGGLAAWAKISLGTDESTRTKAEEKLKERLVDAMVGCREGGKRSAQAVPPPGDLAARSAAFAQQLLALPPEELGM